MHLVHIWHLLPPLSDGARTFLAYTGLGILVWLILARVRPIE